MPYFDLCLIFKKVKTPPLNIATPAMIPMISPQLTRDGAGRGAMSSCCGSCVGWTDRGTGSAAFTVNDDFVPFKSTSYVPASLLLKPNSTVVDAPAPSVTLFVASGIPLTIKVTSYSPEEPPVLLTFAETVIDCPALTLDGFAVTSPKLNFAGDGAGGGGATTFFLPMIA